MQTQEKKRVISAIGELGRRVTPADVATKTGLPLLVAQQELNRVASETGGHLQVGSTGDVVYSFAPGFSNAYLAKGLAAAFQTVFSKILQVAFYLVRISFGIALILTFIIIVVLLIAIMIIMMKGNDRDDRGGGFDFDFGGFNLSFWDWMILRDLFWWNAMRSRPVYYDYSQPTIRNQNQSNFLLNCFSFLFGDGNPNEGLDEKRWQVIAQVIKKHNGVVTAEQLAPYTGADPKREDGVLPTLVRFNGRPEVTESGNIVYVFDSMQTTAANQRAVSPPAYLQEFPWKFTNVPGSALTPVYLLAGFNLIGGYAAWSFFQKLLLEANPDGPPPSSEVFVVKLLSVLLAYSVAFVAIPIVRAIVNAVRNKGIEERNKKRMAFAEIVQSPSTELQNKLIEAGSYRVKARHLTDKDVVFTTESDSRDQADELSEKFEQLESGKKTDATTRRKSTRPMGGGRIDDAKPPEPAHDDDEGRVIDIRRRSKHNEEFDASP